MTALAQVTAKRRNHVRDIAGRDAGTLCALAQDPAAERMTVETSGSTVNPRAVRAGHMREKVFEIWRYRRGFVRRHDRAGFLIPQIEHVGRDLPIASSTNSASFAAGCPPRAAVAFRAQFRAR
jgi:hypothetical protein